MSFYVMTVDFLSFKPRTWIDGERLISRTSFLGQCITLFAFARRVIVDRQERIVTIKNRILWLIHTSREVEFDKIARIDYSYSEFGSLLSWNVYIGKTDQFEAFTVSLVTGTIYEEKLIKLWTFWGEGSVVTGWPGWLTGDSAVDLSGKQESQSRDYVSLLKEFTGKTLT